MREKAKGASETGEGQVRERERRGKGQTEGRARIGQDLVIDFIVEEVKRCYLLLSNKKQLNCSTRGRGYINVNVVTHIHIVRLTQSSKITIILTLHSHGYR